MNKKIYDIVLSDPGSYDNAAVWSLSWVKAWLETRSRIYKDFFSDRKVCNGLERFVTRKWKI